MMLICITNKPIYGLSLNWQECIWWGGIFEPLLCQVLADEHVFLFDVLSMGQICFDEGLAAVLENEDQLKVRFYIYTISFN